MDFLPFVLSTCGLVPLALLPIIGAIGSAPALFVPVTRGRTLRVHRLARQVAVHAWLALIVCLLIGIYVLPVVGVSLSLVRLGCGLLVTAAGVRTFPAGKDGLSQMQALEARGRLSLPFTIGPATVAGSLALGSQLPGTVAVFGGGTVTAALGAALGAALAAWVLYFTFQHATAVVTRLGSAGTLVMFRLHAVLLMFIGAQTIWAGWVEAAQLAVTP